MSEFEQDESIFDTSPSTNKIEVAEEEGPRAPAAPEAKETVKVVLMNKLRYLLVEDPKTGQRLLYRKSNPQSDEVIPQNLEKEPMGEITVNPETGKTEFKPL
jgi:hypothetical protein